MLGWTYTWEHGRQLASMSSGGTTWSFDYNADGLRYRRSNGSTTYTYYYNGDMLRYLDINGTKLYFVLDADGKPIEVSYKPANSTTTSFYFYVHNLMGDVMAILDTSGNAVVKYTYDAWGNIISTTGSMASTLGQQNPFRYRSYVYDQETGLYYLQSRYYNPQIGRFINADALVSTGQGILGNNMFAYCRNNPVIRKDASGTEDVTVEDCNQDNNHANDLGNPSGGGSGGVGVKSGGQSTPQTLPKNGLRLGTDDALKLAEDYLGSGYQEKSPGRFVSADGMRQVRMGNSDLLGTHGGGPHINFDRLTPSYKTVHVYFVD